MDLLEVNQFNSNRHPWEISRAKCILDLLKRYPDNFQYADIGSGDLYFSNQLRKLTKKSIYAVDTNYKRETEFERIIRVKDIERLPENSMDCIILMDVLEHIENEEEFLNNVLSRLKDNGVILITVPAHQFLFSEHDIFLKHYRRYNNKQLINLLNKFDFKIETNFYFYTSLFFIRLIQYLTTKLGVKYNMKKTIGHWNFSENSFITKAVVIILNVDFFVNKILSKFNILLKGLSLCIICKKKFA